MQSNAACLIKFPGATVHVPVLVVEDDEYIGEALCHLLARHGYRPTLCTDAIDALDWLRAGNQPELILLDLMMPRMDGWKFRRAFGSTASG